MHNMDETGFPFFNPGSVIITDHENEHPYEAGSDSKHQITVLGCISAGGGILHVPLTIIYMYLGVNWTFDPKRDIEDADYCLTPNGWINSTFLN